MADNKISKNTLMPISFVILIIGVSSYIFIAKAQVDRNSEIISEVKETYITRETVQLQLKPITDDISEIKGDINKIANYLNVK